jgi:predicted O-methyltransferase YrrM
MSRETLNLTPVLREYLLSVSLREHPVLKQLREATEGHPEARYQISPEQGQLMGQLVTLMGARRIIEVGVFTGYSSLAMALAMPRDGRLVACDTSVAYTDVAKEYWKSAGVEGRIDLRIGPAEETLQGMIRSDEAGQYDFAFIDADKERYDSYYEQLLQLLRPGGLITVDNVLWSGRVIDSDVADTDTESIRAFNAKLHTDNRVALSMIPIGDGLTLAMKR